MSIDDFKRTIIATFQKGADQERSNLHEEADKTWVHSRQLIIDKVESGDHASLISLAENLIREGTEASDGYLINAGLSILAITKIVESIIAQGRQDYFKPVLLRHIPSQDKIGGIDGRSATMYNFLMAVESLLGLDRAEVLRVLTEKHIEILKEASEPPDMDGTLIKKIFGKDSAQE